MKASGSLKETEKKTFRQRKEERKAKPERISIPVVNCAICLMNVGAKIKGGEIISIGKCTDKNYNSTNIPGIINAIGECANSACENYENIS